MKPDTGKQKKQPLRYWLGKLLSAPRQMLNYAAGKWAAIHISIRLSEDAVPLRLPIPAIVKLKGEWSKLSGTSLLADESRTSVEGSTQRATDGASQRWTHTEIDIIEQIRKEASDFNRNNVTRTEAYRSIYFQKPELHWALLAHMVSRNGGWNMTDLKGEWLPRLLTEEQRTDVFLFLEQANAAIFQDAYPQLKLYEWSVRVGRSLFHLLPAFGVSVFMHPVWRQFWRERDPVPLTVALIVNEQHYIEQHVVQQPFMRERVLHKLFFELQSLLQLNGVVFPYGRMAPSSPSANIGESRLAGLILERFENIEERIEFGKRLYTILFGVPAVYQGVKRFACAVPHTGSRADYAPHLFTRTIEYHQSAFYTERLSGSRLKDGAEPIHSPELHEAWPDRPNDKLEKVDWFKGLNMVERYFEKLPLPVLFEITEEYARMLSKIEMAVLLRQAPEG